MKIAHLFCYTPNLCRSSAEATNHSGRVNQYRYSGELYSNQQHTVDIYHTPVPRFSAIEKGTKSGEKDEIEFSVVYVLRNGPKIGSAEIYSAKLDFNISSTVLRELLRETRAIIRKLLHTRAKGNRVEGNKLKRQQAI